MLYMIVEYLEVSSYLFYLFLDPSFFNLPAKDYLVTNLVTTHNAQVHDIGCVSTNQRI